MSNSDDAMRIAMGFPSKRERRYGKYRAESKLWRALLSAPTRHAAQSCLILIRIRRGLS